MMHAAGVCHPIYVAPASQYGADSLSTAIPATSRLVGHSKAGAGPAEGPPNQRTAELCVEKNESKSVNSGHALASERSVGKHGNYGIEDAMLLTSERAW